MWCSRDPLPPDVVQFKSKVNQDVFFQIFIVQRQSKLDEVTGRTGEADGLGGIPATQPPLTTPLERRDIPPQLSMTLEHIVGQLDVLTQVGRGNISEQGIICRNQEPWVWGGDAHLLMTPSPSPSPLGSIPRVEGGPWKEQKGVAWWKADTYQFRINVHFKTSFLKQDKRLWNRGRGFHTVVNFCYFLLLAFQKHGLFYSESGIFCGKALQSFSLYLFILPLKMDFLIARSTLPFPLKKDYLIARLSSFLQQRLAVKSITAFGEKVMNSLV